jgi:sulfoxide reductase heme-binding subunit YedZ
MQMTNAQFAKLVVLVNGLVPPAIMAWDAFHGGLGANPIEFVLHTSGTLALVFLGLSLLVTPLRKISGVNFFSHFRRMLGLLAFTYALAHLATYVIFAQFFSPLAILRDVLEHPYIAVGMAGFAMMVPLAWTSTNAAVKRMGAARWKRLHRLAYAAAAAGVVHYYLLVKIDTRLPIAFGVVIGVLLLFRVVDAIRSRQPRAAG